MLTTFCGIVLLIALISTPDNGKNQFKRLVYLVGFAFSSGLGLCPLLEIAIIMNPSIVVSALIGNVFYKLQIFFMFILN